MEFPRRFYCSVSRMVALIACCGIVSAMSFALLYCLPSPRWRPALWIYFALVAALTLGGMIVMSIAASRMRDAIQNGLWPDSEVEVWRRRTCSWWWQSGMGLSLLAMLAALLVSHNHHSFPHGYMLVYSPFFVVIQTFAQIGAAFRKPPTPFGGPPIWKDWRNFGKLHSDHWGQR
jgi:hypothetical protein